MPIRLYAFIICVPGISMHKGFAFVQFTNPFDARSACVGEDARTVLGQTLGNYDVKIVILYSTGMFAVWTLFIDIIPFLF